MKGRIAARLCSMLLALAAAACSATTPIERPVSTAAEAVAQIATATPPAPTATPDALQSLLAQLEATPVRFVVPTALPETENPWRPPPYEAPLALRPEDHFYFLRPIPSGEVNWPHPLYRYGGTFFGENTVHTGVDLPADRGTPVLAAGSGVVVWEGFGLYRGIDDPDDPYGLAVAIRHDFGYAGQQLYTIYAHMDRSYVWLGQRVEAGQQIGEVGATGRVSGPHLHFEVRQGSTPVNPLAYLPR